jgi:hypothetical protein
LHNFNKENSTSSKLEILGKFEHAFGILRKPSMSRIIEAILKFLDLRCEGY